jgi:transcriptional regulator with XRE-family HTH domain
MNFDRLEELAEERGVSRARLCKVIGKDRRYIERCKNGGIKVSAEHIAAWAEVLDTTAEYLTSETEQKDKTPFEEVLNTNLNAREFFNYFMTMYKKDPAQFFEIVNFYSQKIEQTVKQEDEE